MCGKIFETEAQLSQADQVGQIMHPLKRCKTRRRNHQYDYGKQISAARKSLGMTQAKLADKLGVSTEAVGKWEKDVYAPSAENEEKNYRVLGIARAGDNRRDVVLFYERNMSAFLKGKFNSGEINLNYLLSSTWRVWHGRYEEGKG